MFRSVEPLTKSHGAAREKMRILGRLRRLMGRCDEGDRRLLVYMAQKMANR